MALIKENDIVTLRKYVKMSFTTSAVNSMPDLESAERDYLLPIVGTDVYQDLLQQVADNNILWPALLTLCRAAIAPLAVWADLPFMQASIEDGGIKTTFSDHKQAAHQWEYKEIEQALINKGSKILDQLIEHLLIHGAGYGWVNADTTASFFRTGSDFSKYAPIHQANLTFQQLKPLIAEVEDHFIRAAIGNDFFEELRDKQAFTQQEKYAYTLIKKATAQYTIVRAAERLPVKITPYGLLATIENASRETRPATPAAGDQMALLLQSAQREGDSYHVQLKNFLNLNASATLFTTYFTSSYYSAPVVTVADNSYPRGYWDERFYDDRFCGEGFNKDNHYRPGFNRRGRGSFNMF